MSRAGRAYLTSVIVAGVLVLGRSLGQLALAPLAFGWFVLAGLTLLSGSATVRLRPSFASISISEVFVFAAVLLYGTAAGTVIVALDGLVISFWLAKRHREISRALFNMSGPAVSIWCSAQLFFATSGLAPFTSRPATLNKTLWPLFLFAVTYFALNTWLITIAIAFERKVSAWNWWTSRFLWLCLNYFSAASVAVLLVVSNPTVDFRFIGLIIPLLLFLYFAFKTAVARVEDADRHVEEVNLLYLSTVQTLAMAIDAKDQVTHGHIRRVQEYAVGLARRVGVSDPDLIKAIEAAALLHDMGKLAVPEYILNKPGKLTPVEFEKMKLHASVGADILSAVDFPYPVVPIVRHHHENWDGTGYPSGIRSTDIPIGARILSVVDCFDALTSDRPYRPRLSDEEAIKILLERRGSMYDPLVVDIFVDVYKEIAPASHVTGPPSRALQEIATSTQLPVGGGPSRLDDITASADEMLTLYELARALAGQASIGDTGDVIAKHLRRLVPSSLCVFYLYDPAKDELEASHAVGDAASSIRGLRIELGQRLSGWVAANRQTIVNSDATLDLGEVARCVTPRLRSCLSTPLVFEEMLVGVLSLYSSTADSFTDDHRRVVEIAARQIAHTFKSAAEFERGSTRRDPITGLPDLRQMQHVVSPPTDAGVRQTSILFIDVVALKRINESYGRAIGDEALRHVARHARAGLRVADILFRCASDEFAALLNNTDPATAQSIARGVKGSIECTPFMLRDGTTVQIPVTLTCVSAPDDGRSLADLIAAARLRSQATAPNEQVH